ncbi:MAG: hypothetical protein KAT28_02845 [Candidatus Aenigmarchaeota archaeon]|nr:hypothetical protein [Candidatus Aenigmarchaeota archaeon]
MEKIAESDRVWKNGVAEGEIIRYWQSNKSEHSDGRFKTKSDIEKYAKDNPVILVVDLMIGSGTYNQLCDSCEGFIMNDFPGSSIDYPNPNIIPNVRDKPIAVMEYALGLHRKELERVPYENRKELWEKYPTNLNCPTDMIGGKQYSVMVEDGNEEIFYDSDRASLKEGQKVRLECKDGKAVVYEIGE